MIYYTLRLLCGVMIPLACIGVKATDDVGGSTLKQVVQVACNKDEIKKAGLRDPDGEYIYKGGYW